MIEALRELFWLSTKCTFGLRSVHIRDANNDTSDIISRSHKPKYLAKLYDI